MKQHQKFHSLRTTPPSVSYYSMHLSLLANAFWFFTWPLGLSRGAGPSVFGYLVDDIYS
jgi:hypothetical protein